MNRKFFSLALTLFVIPLSTFAGVKVASVNLQTKGSNGYLSIAVEGKSQDLPEVNVNGKTIEITLGKALAFNSIFKKEQGAQLSASAVNGKAIVKATVPYQVKEDAINLGWKNNTIEVIFPVGVVEKKEAPKANSVPVAKVEVKKPVVAAKNSISKDVLNEDYLNKLMKENETTSKKKVVTNHKDSVSVKQAATVKTETKEVDSDKSASGDSFSFAGYAAKFTVFLAMVLGLFYGVVQLLKKGVFNRGKLGFLNNTQMIEVLSTTYVSPKRTLMVVRAHKQIFLVANSESGFTFLSEMKDTTGLIKEGEKSITGTNFDLNLSEADLNGLDDIKLKEDIMNSTPVEEKGLAKLAAKKDDIVKFSDELKKKAKKLRPIEFN